MRSFQQGRDGTFGDPRILVGSPLQSIDIAAHVEVFDVDGDGLDDVFMASNHKVDVFFGRADRNLSNPTPLDAYGDENNQFALGDVDGDGTVDVVSDDDSLTSIQYLEAGGKPRRRPIVYYRGNLRVGIGFVADMNGDARADLVGALPYGVGVALTGVDGVPHNNTPYVLPSADASGLETVPADVNRDGITDVVVFSSNTTQIGVMFGKGDGSLASPVESTIRPKREYVMAHALGDLDGDGVVDIAEITESEVAFLHGSKNGSLQRWVSNLTAPMIGHDLVVSAAFADFDGDGKADLVEADQNTMRVFLRR